MTVTGGKASATLTEVKNKIGEVFTLADEYGEVTITSYNRPKYKIARLTARGQVSPGLTEGKEKNEEEMEPAKIEEKPSAEVPKEPTSDQAASTLAKGIIGIFSGISTDELWQRDNKREELWTKQVRART